MCAHNQPAPASAHPHPPPPADYCAAALIDRPWCGRMRMQAGGFLMLFLLFLLQGALFTSLEQHSGAFQVGGDVHGHMGRPFHAVPMSRRTMSRPFDGNQSVLPSHPHPLFKPPLLSCSTVAAALLPVQLLCPAGAQLHHLPHRGRGVLAMHCLTWIACCGQMCSSQPRLARGSCADAAAAPHHHS